MTDNNKQYIEKVFGVNEELFYLAIKGSSSARGYIHGAISEVLLAKYLEENGFEWLRIKEKPSGGYDAKSAEARGDFYMREKGTGNKYFVIECKGVKTNAEKRGDLTSREKVLKYLKKFAFPPKDFNKKRYDRGFNTYKRAKEKWEKDNPRKSFPPFKWKLTEPGCDSINIKGLWNNLDSIRKWVYSFKESDFSENAYWECQAPIALIQTHMPSKRVSPITGKEQAGPLINDFSILAVDLYLRTGTHEFVFMNPEKISHSPGSPEHLYQNYTLDVLIKDKKPKIDIVKPWYLDIKHCIADSKPARRKLDETQIDKR